MMILSLALIGRQAVQHAAQQSVQHDYPQTVVSWNPDERKRTEVPLPNTGPTRREPATSSMSTDESSLVNPRFRNFCGSYKTL